MRALRYTGLLLLTFGVAYILMITGLCRFHLNGKPAVYLTNDYYMWKGGDTYEKFREFEKSGAHDVVVLGSSRAYRGYDPSAFEKAGFSMFNLGTSAQSVINTAIIAKHYITAANTRLLIIDVFTGAFKSAQLESSSDIIENISNDATASEVAWKAADVRALNMMWLRKMTSVDAPYYKENDYLGNGFSIRKDSLPKKKCEQLKTFHQPSQPDLKPDPSSLNSFRELLTYCKTNSIPVVVVYSPVSDFYSRANHKVLLDSIQPMMKSLGVPFYDFTTRVKLNTTRDFYDETHMNISGVRIFNDSLLKDLQADGVLHH